MIPLISVVSTLYNYRKYVCDMVNSVLNQIYPNWELIIVDDGSTDIPGEVLEPYLKDKRIQYIRFDDNHGYSFAKNEGIIRTKGDYIVMIDADDLLTRNSLQVRYEALKNFPEKLWCHGKVYSLDFDGELRTSDAERREKLIENEADSYHHRFIHSQSVMIRPEFHKILGLYDESLRFSSDNEMFRRAIKFNIIPLYVREFVSIYRLHKKQMFRSDFKKRNIKTIKQKILNLVQLRYEEGINRENTRLWE